MVSQTPTSLLNQTASRLVQSSGLTVVIKTHTDHAACVAIVRMRCGLIILVITSMLLSSSQVTAGVWRMHMFFMFYVGLLIARLCFVSWHCILLVGWFIDCLYYINLFSCIAANLSDKLTFLLLLSAGWPPTLKPNQPSWTVSSPISCCRPHTTSTTLDVYRLTGRSVWKAELTRDGRHVPCGGSSHCGVLHKHTTAHGEIRDVSLGPLV